jgi:hypothetical protein
MKYAQDYHIVPLLLLSDTDTAALPFVDMSHYLWCDFVVGLGACGTDSADITVEECTANATSGATLVALPFRYRTGVAVGSDTIGALTTCDSGGFGVDSDVEFMYVIGVDPKDLDDGYRYVRVKFAQQTNTDSFVAQVFAILHPRYAADTMISST